MKIKKIGISCISLFLLVLTGWGQTCIWEVEKDGRKLFIGATCQGLLQEDYPLPMPFLKAYDQSKTLVLESDMDRTRSDEFQKKAIRMSIYKDGTTIKNHLSPKVYQKLVDAYQSNNLNLANFSSFKLPTVMMLLNAMELKKVGITSITGVDAYFFKQAKKDKKQIKALEDPEAQIKMILGLADGIEDEFVLHSFNEMKDPKTKFRKIIHAWKAGDLKKLTGYLQKSTKGYPNLYQKMITNRNSEWIPKFESFLQTPEKELILVGFSHVVGDNSILNMLKKRGCTVRLYTGK